LENTVFKNDAARKRMEHWYRRFLERIPVKTGSTEIETSFGKTHLLTIGDSSNPPLVCLHSMMTSSAHLASELVALLDRFFIIAPDIPGQSVRGLPVRLSFTDNSHADWLGQVLDGLSLQQVHLLGVSLGGFVARQFASSHPERVKSLVLIVPAGIVQGSLVKGFAKMAIPMIMYRLSPNEKRRSALVKHLITTWDEDWVGYLGDAFNDFTPNLKIPPLASPEDLERLTMPCLVIGAEHDISFPGGKVIERVQAHIPGVQTELIRDSLHSPPTTPEFRKWLGERIGTFHLTPQED